MRFFTGLIADFKEILRIVFRSTLKQFIDYKLYTKMNLLIISFSIPIPLWIYMRKVGKIYMSVRITYFFWRGEKKNVFDTLILSLE